MSAVQPANRPRDPADEVDRRRPSADRIPATDVEVLAARAEETRAIRQGAPSARANRALNAYASVAEAGDRSSLKELLGFDAYA